MEKCASMAASYSTIDSIINQFFIKRRSNQWRPNLSEEVLLSIIKATASLLIKEPSLLELDGPVSVVGDIHGSLSDLLDILTSLGLPKNRRYLFLGDYVDRGINGISVMCMLMCLKLKYPSHIYLLRGNHESSLMNDRCGFLDECLDYYSKRVYDSFQSLFNCLPLSALVSKCVFCCHGGLSPSFIDLDSIRSIKRPCLIPKHGLLFDLLWSDPAPSSSYKGWHESTRPNSYMFGEDVVDDFLARTNCQLIIRGHQLCNGFRILCNRKVVTIHSVRCQEGKQQFAAGVIEIDEKLNCSFVVLKSLPLENWA